MRDMLKIENELHFRGRKMLYDIHYQEDGRAKPVIIFIHGFKGFKDWGHFNLMADYFASRGYIYIKLNFSHNGTTRENPTEFVDLHAFGNNNLSMELDETGGLIDHLFSANCEIPDGEADLDRLFLIGHSRGGGLAILKSREDARIKAVVSLAPVHDFEKRWSPEEIEEWKKEGVRYIYNGRTGQEMPLLYQLVEDFYRNRSRLDIPAAVKSLKQPLLIIHGSADETLPLSEAREFKIWNQDATLMIMEGANHTFGGYHPYDQKKLPPHTQTAVEKIDSYLKQVGLS